jgi:hypothetical protein
VTTAKLFLGNGNDRFWPVATRAAIAGEPFEVTYYRDPPAQEPLSAARAFYRVNGRTLGPVEMDASQLLYGESVKLDIPPDASGLVEVWFELTTKSGATVLDSNDGAFFVAPIIPLPGALWPATRQIAIA